MLDTSHETSDLIRSLCPLFADDLKLSRYLACLRFSNQMR